MRALDSLHEVDPIFCDKVIFVVLAFKKKSVCFTLIVLLCRYECSIISSS